MGSVKEGTAGGRARQGSYYRQTGTRASEKISQWAR